jgi:hypothetical protein
MTEFGNLSIKDRDQIEAETKSKIVSGLEQELAEVRIGCDQDRQSPSWTGLAD